MDYYKAINKAIMEGETRDVVDLTREALTQLYPPEKILNDGLIQGIELVAEKFREAELLVPEVILSTRAVQAGLKTIKPYLEADVKNKQVRVMIGTVSGDLHDIGKNIIKIVAVSYTHLDVYKRQLRCFCLRKRGKNEPQDAIYPAPQKL